MKRKRSSEVTPDAKIQYTVLMPLEMYLSVFEVINTAEKEKEMQAAVLQAITEFASALKGAK